jgi:predicted RecA/RadA family phage recombinase
MSKNEIHRPGYNLSLACTDPATPASGDIVRYGTLIGIAQTDERADGTTTVYFGPCVVELLTDDDAGTGIAAGDALFYRDATSGSPATHLSNVGTSGYFAGFALETVGANATTVIQVLRTPSPGAGTLGTGTVGSTELATNSVGSAEIQAAAVTKTKLAGAFLKVALAAGTGSGADVTVAAIAVGDELVSVLSFTTAAAIASVVDRTSEYAIQAGGLDKAAGTSETGNQLLIVYLDLT